MQDLTYRRLALEHCHIAQPYPAPCFQNAILSLQHFDKPLIRLATCRDEEDRVRRATVPEIGVCV